MNKIYARKRFITRDSAGHFRISVRSVCIGRRTANSWSFDSNETRFTIVYYLRKYGAYRRAIKVSRLLRHATLVDPVVYYEKHNDMTAGQDWSKRHE